MYDSVPVLRARRTRAAAARHDLFCYGTLEFPAVMRAVAGRLFPGRPAVLNGYRRLTVQGELFPGIVAQCGAAVAGTVYSGLTAAHLRLLDAYEHPLYRRQRRRVRDAVGRRRTAWVYVIPAMYRHRLGAAWDPALFGRRDCARYLRRLRRRPRHDSGMPSGVNLPDTSSVSGGEPWKITRIFDAISCTSAKRCWAGCRRSPRTSAT